MNLTLTAVHIPRVENTVTDSLSRLELSGDYQIKKSVIWPALQKFTRFLQFEKGKERKRRKKEKIKVRQPKDQNGYV
jgi:hypothetical protein